MGIKNPQSGLSTKVDICSLQARISNPGCEKVKSMYKKAWDRPPAPNSGGAKRATGLSCSPIIGGEGVLTGFLYTL